MYITDMYVLLQKAKVKSLELNGGYNNTCLGLHFQRQDRLYTSESFVDP